MAIHSAPHGEPAIPDWYDQGGYGVEPDPFIPLTFPQGHVDMIREACNDPEAFIKRDIRAHSTRIKLKIGRTTPPTNII